MVLLWYNRTAFPLHCGHFFFMVRTTEMIWFAFYIASLFLKDGFITNASLNQSLKI
jgi:hypothetical protein